MTKLSSIFLVVGRMENNLQYPHFTFVGIGYCMPVYTIVGTPIVILYPVGIRFSDTYNLF
jgi:hypothetical protein